MALDSKIWDKDDKRTWREAGNRLLSLLAHENLEVRRQAARKIGWFYTQATKQLHTYHDFVQEENGEFTDNEITNGLYEREQEICDRLPPLPQMFEIIQTLEIDGFGIAGVFLSALSEAEDKLLARHRRFDLHQWLWHTLARSPTLEPLSTLLTLTFDCLGFHIAMRFLEDVEAAWRCLDLGRRDVAYLIAMYLSDRPVDGMEPVLMALGCDRDPEVVRRISWHLAYYYHVLHPQGALLGYVEQIQGLPEIDLFLLQNQRESSESTSESPFAAIVYAQGKGNYLEDEIARKWLDRICPACQDGIPIGDREFPYEIPPMRNWQQMGFRVEYCRYDDSSSHNEEAPNWYSVKVWGRDCLDWNPKLRIAKTQEIQS
ncbi:hypothetical protein V2H45_23330 [Tumidithrix elongata RA019]|uniref:HEAT repeat domain-containing protein n=1 Tax=Tumidithrix elongata BACA0141 TaxID=2716417 RepID=A0AAW9Q907_9CYAN|nr:hypothetical protein [Tumidithrix elongata RA019]